MNPEERDALLIEIRTDIKYLREGVDKVPQLREDVTRLQEQTSTIKCEVDKIRSNDNIWKGVFGALVVIAGALGIKF